MPSQHHTVSISALPAFPLVQEGDDIGALIVECIQRNDFDIAADTIIVVAQKIVSKAEGRAIRLSDVTPGKDALSLAETTGKDPRLVELILAESNEVIRQAGPLLITENKLGIIMANAGIDQSNIDAGYALLLPEDPDLSARRIGADISTAFGANAGVVIADSAGRPWRRGVVGIAIGVHGMPAVHDIRGETDLNSRELVATEVGAADAIAAAATLLMGQADEGTPVALVSGFSFDSPSSAAVDILRDKDSDLFR
ncbi:MAG: coenzyme F420-0:L-glutamate ligase [Woeseiaceae bacterium]